MFGILLKTIFICFITFIKFNYVQSNENDSYVDYEFDSFSNDSEIDKGLSSSDYFDYNELNISEDSVDDCHKQSLVENIKLIHEEGKNVTFTKHVKHINETFNVINNLRNVFTKLFPADSSTGLEILEFLTDLDLELSHECSVALFRILTDIRKYELWAIKFFDSIGNVLPSGFVEGIQSSFGEYDECLNIKSPPIDGKYIKGQYCVLKLILPFPPLLSKDTYKEAVHPNDEIRIKFTEEYHLQHLNTIKTMIEMLNRSNGAFYRLGICIPSVCSAHEFENMLNKILYPITRFPVEIGPKCHTKDETIKLDNFQLFSITLLIILTFIVILSTGLEIYKNKNQLKIHENSLSKPTKIKDIFLSFSIIRNTQTLFAINKRFAALDTLRLLFILNVHIEHIYVFSTSMGLISLKKIFSEVMYTMLEDNRYFFARSHLMIDALFTLSGFLLSFGLLKKLEKNNGCFNYFGFLFQRWFRFLILLFGSILFYYLLPLSGSGPIWDSSEKLVTTGCKTPYALLDNFLFINNFRGEFVGVQHLKCNPVSWYLSSLLQLTIIAPIFIIIYFKNKIIGIYAIITTIIISLFASISPYLLMGIKPYLQIWDLETTIVTYSISMKWYHLVPYIYATSFFVGIAFGYLLIEKALFSRKIEVLFWILSTICIIGVYLWNNSFWRLDKSAPLLSSLLYFSIGKLLFSIGFAWIYFTCSSGRGGYINQFLSWHGFQPIARLSFGIYLLHYLVVIHRIFSVKNIYVISDKLMFENTLVDIIYDTILAYIFYILIEGPFNNIFGLLMNPKSKVKSDYLNNNNCVSKL